MSQKKGMKSVDWSEVIEADANLSHVVKLLILDVSKIEGQLKHVAFPQDNVWLYK